MLYFFFKYWYAFVGAALFFSAGISIWIFPHPITLISTVSVSTVALFFLYTYRHRKGPWFRMPGTASWGMPPVFLCGFLLLEHRADRLFFLIASSALVGLLLASPVELLPTNPNQKAWRRLYMVIITLCAFWGVAILSTIDIFFPAVWGIVLALLCGAGMGLLSFIAIALFFPLHAELRRIAAVYAFISAELFAALALTPWSPLPRAVLFTWFWYIAIRLTRFACSEEGVRMHEQRTVLIVNTLLMFIYIFSLRFV